MTLNSFLYGYFQIIRQQMNFPGIDPDKARTSGAADATTLALEAESIIKKISGRRP